MTEPQKKLTSSQRKHYEALLLASEKRKDEDKDLGCLVGGTLGAGGGVIATIITPMTGGVPAVISGVAGCATGKDFVESKYEKQNKFSNDQERYKALLQDERLASSKNRKDEDIKLGCEVGRDIGNAITGGPVNGVIGCELGEWVVEKKYNNQDTPEKIRDWVKKNEPQVQKDFNPLFEPFFGKANPPVEPPLINIPPAPPPKDKAEKGR